MDPAATPRGGWTPSRTHCSRRLHPSRAGPSMMPGVRHRPRIRPRRGRPIGNCPRRTRRDSNVPYPTYSRLGKLTIWKDSHLTATEEIRPCLRIPKFPCTCRFFFYILFVPSVRFSGQRHVGWVHETLNLAMDLLDDPRRIFRLPGAQRILLCEAREIYRVPLPFTDGRTRSCFCYLFANHSWRRALRWNSALRIMRVAEDLSNHGIPSLTVLAALRPASQLLDWDSFLIAREIPSVCELPSKGRHVYRVHPTVRMCSALVGRLARAVADFHRAGFFHGDLKSRHILLSSSSNPRLDVHFVDLEKCRRLPWLLPPAIKDLFRSRDLIQLFSSLDIPGESRTTFDSFLREYFGRLNAGPLRERIILRLLGLYGPHGYLSQGRTILRGVSDGITRASRTLGPAVPLKQECQSTASGTMPTIPAGSPLTDPRNPLVELAKRLSIHSPIICDIGSRDATEGLILMKHLEGRELHIFEPNPAAAEKCRINLSRMTEKDGSVFFNEVAVTEKVGVAPFYPVSLPQSDNKDIGFSSLYRINPQYMRRRGRIVQSEILVETVTLDAYFSDREPPDILWVDVEGAELRVFQGATRVLEHVGLIHVEVALRPMQLGRPLFWEVDSYLRGFGFRLVTFTEVSWLTGLLYRYKVLPNLPWRLNAIYQKRRRNE
jgi:2-O-methyltransferase